MTHFAEVINNIVTNVIVAEQEFINKLPNSEEWLKTSYENEFRKNYASIGYTYDKELDAFIPPKPFPSWILNEETCLWNSPIPKPPYVKTIPESGYKWNEDNLKWEKIIKNE